LLIVLVMALVEQLDDRGTLDQRLIRVGWDMCVLALGVAGGVCLNPDVIRAYGEQRAVVTGFFSMALSFGAAVGIALLRRQRPATPWLRPVRPLGALALGGGALAIPVYLAFGI
jgi:cyanate permease